jgi:dipeptidyl aminopeptidase/acylaminoacyl peptidase
MDAEVNPMNHTKIHRQFGLWESPLSPLNLARSFSFSDLAWDHDGTLVWREMRSDRGVLVILSPGGHAPRDFSDELSVRARVGYGGGDFCVGHGWLIFAEAGSGRLFRQQVDCGPAFPITPGFGSYASPTLSPDGRWVLFVHSYENQDSLGVIDLHGQDWPRKLVSGDDFYMQPAWHPDGLRLAWIAWNHPNMPWDGTFLRTGTLSSDEAGNLSLQDVQTLAGSESVSIFQPVFSPDGRYLAYVSDESGWWQIYLHDLQNGAVRQLTGLPADHGQPAWVQGMRTYGFHPDGSSILAIRNRLGFASLWQIELDSGREREIPIDPSTYSWFDQISISPLDSARSGFQVGLLASGATTPPRVITLASPGGLDDANGSSASPGQAGKTAPPLPPWNLLIRRFATAEDIPSTAFAPAQPVQWKGLDGGDVFGLLHSPNNPRFEGVGLPPLIVSIHGGPTSQVRAVFNPRAQFFATRGYAVLEVNHRGSTGYGRPYWEALRGNWGVYDVEDAVSGVKYFAGQGQVDGDRAVIIGGSAGGFTVLMALENHPGVFKAGVCLYGVANQFTLAAETHKFEARYCDSMIGPLPDAAAVYRQRSPQFHADKIQDPVIIFQGEEDQVVPRAQSDAIVAALQQRGIPHEYHLYPGEGHGFRKTETILHLYSTIDKFLKQYVIYA